jgi:enoyl-CoA hydratase/carnithine racemase
MPLDVEHAAYIILDRPDTGNYLDEEMNSEIAHACEHITEDDDIYVVILTNEGDVFCKGGEPSGYAAAELAALDRPVIAAINGLASGVGLELALTADIRICSENSTFSLPQVSDGILPSDGGTQRLPRIVGRGKALELLLTADTISAKEALEIGLVSAIYPVSGLEAETAKLAKSIAAKGPLALRYLKEAVIKGMDLTLEQGLRLEADLYFLLHTTSDRTEGITSFRKNAIPSTKENKAGRTRISNLFGQHGRIAEEYIRHRFY